MKIKSAFFVLVFFLIVIYGNAQATRVKHDFDENWKFQLGDVYAARNPQYNDASWRVLNLPHDWNIELPFDVKWASSTGYLPSGIGWYRKSFEVLDSYKDKIVTILFDGVYNTAMSGLTGITLARGLPDIPVFNTT